MAAAKQVLIELDMPGDLGRFRLPSGVDRRLAELLDKQDDGRKLTADERKEAEGLVDMVEMLSLLRLRANNAKRRQKKSQ